MKKMPITKFVQILISDTLRHAEFNCTIQNRGNTEIGDLQLATTLCCTITIANRRLGSRRSAFFQLQIRQMNLRIRQMKFRIRQMKLHLILQLIN